MTIEQLVTMAKRIHDAEGINLGDGSSREYRNAFWARVVGCAHHGHLIYNVTPDRQWHLKKASLTSPQSDDVVVSMPSRDFWDCIPGSGANGYTFKANGPELLPIPPQVIIVPPVPSGSGVPVPPDPPVPQPCTTLGREEALDELKRLDAYYAAPEGLQRPQGLSLNGKPDFEGIAAWYLDVYEKERIVNKKTREQARGVYVSNIRHSDEWRQKHPGETP